jgi:hypothetical protein
VGGVDGELPRVSMSVPLVEDLLLCGRRNL